MLGNFFPEGHFILLIHHFTYAPLLVSEQCVCLQPGSDPGVDWKAVVGTGSLELPNLSQNLKLLHVAKRKQSG